MLGHLDRDRPDEDRLAELAALLDVLQDGLVLGLLVLVDVVVLVVAHHRLVGRDLDDGEVVDLLELLLLRLGRAGHAGELLVQAEVVLERDRGERDVLFLDRDALLRLDGLVEAVRPAAPLHDPAGELVHDLDLAVHHDVVVVAVVERLGLERLDQVVHELGAVRVVEVVDAERRLDLVDRRLHGRHVLELLVVGVVRVAVGLLALRADHHRDAGERLHDAREVVVGLGGRLGLAGDDERRPGLVDQDRVDLVHDRVRVAALRGSLARRRHVVAQVVEPELRVRAVRDVRGVGLLALVRGHHVADEAGAQAERLVDRAHPLHVALRQVVVHGDEMHVHARQRVQVERQRRDERLSLAGLHLGDVALVERDPAHQLDVEVAHAERALSGLAHRGERLEEDLLERLAVFDALTELDRLRGELGVAQLLEVGLERRDVRRLLREPLRAASLAQAKDLLESTVVVRHQRSA